jgi:lipopolysaccharide cholinephosphotransferase
MRILNNKVLFMQACQNSKDLHVMTDEERNKLQAHLRQIYLDIEKVCQKHDLQMMVAYGTVLGALRHKGFIPWDDDIDLMMPRKDYDLLVNKYAEELPAKYKIFSPNSKYGPIYRFAKVVDTTTRFTLSPSIATEKNGIFVDIFPLENAFTGKLRIRWIQLKACFLMYVATSVANWKSKSKEEKLLMTTSIAGSFIFYLRQSIGFLFCWRSPEKWYDTFDKTVTNNPESGFFMVPSGGPNYKYFMPMDRNIFLPTKRMPFDDIEVNVPNMPEVHCEIEYGDWRRIPPENERWQHFISEIKFSLVE